MARKKIGTIKQSGGLSSLIGETKEDTKDQTSQEHKTEKPLTKTFHISKEDFDFINEYAGYRTFKDKKKYTQKDVIHEALKLLKQKVSSKLEGI